MKSVVIEDDAADLICDAFNKVFTGMRNAAVQLPNGDIIINPPSVYVIKELDTELLGYFDITTPEAEPETELTHV